ncbi:MAG: HlyD family efflux transporter periplasmic adaptor subunit [Acidobacteria bacterium]|nr:HlyD family efflux transporter periplasmic adaptor subunit [Acidobacteriota bacterium]
MKASRRRLLWLLLAIAMAVAVILATRPRPVPAEIATVERGQLIVTLDEEGETRVRDRFVISAPLAGKVLRIELEPGDEVLHDETVVASFQPSAPVLLDARSRAEAEAGVEAAEASVGRAQALYEQSLAETTFAEAEAKRYETLAKEGIVSDEQLETTRLDLVTRREALEAAQYLIGNARGALLVARSRLVQVAGSGDPDRAIILRSPVDGVVLRRLRESEAIVPAGEPLLEIGDPEQLEIVTDYLSKDAVRLRPGQRVLIERWGGDKPLKGRVRRVEPSGFTKISALGVEEQRVNVVIDLIEPPSVWSGLGDGFRVETRVVTWEGTDVVKVPTGALFRSEEAWAVFVVVGGKATLRTIDIGERNPRGAQVLAGLDPGDEVVVHPSDSLADGTPVRRQ